MQNYKPRWNNILAQLNPMDQGLETSKSFQELTSFEPIKYPSTFFENLQSSALIALPVALVILILWELLHK